MDREPVIASHPLILPDDDDPERRAWLACLLQAAQMRAIGRDDLARVFERNAAEVAAIGVRK